METIRVKEEAGTSRKLDEGLCRVCLSSNRKVSFANEFKALLVKICDIDVKDLSTSLYLCWECVSFLRKVKQFRKKVQTVNCILKYSLNDQKPPQPLSSLCLSETNITDSFDLIEEKKPEIIEPPKITTNIKVEYDIDNDIYDDTIDYEPIDEIKDENVTETILKVIKKENEINKPKINKTKRYTLIVKKLKNVDDLIETVPLDDTELSDWMERDRNSDFFKRLKNKCDICLRRLTDSKKVHRNKCHRKSSNRPYDCQICKLYLTSSNHGVHFREHVGHSCKLCPFKCYARWSMVYHLRKDHSRLVKCLDCDATFHKLREFFKHYRKYHTLFICNDCGIAKRCKDSLIRHIQRHHATSYFCEICNVKLKNHHSYQSHVALRHTVQRTEASFCVQCNIQFNNITLFKRHVNTSVAHRGERCEIPKKETYKCTECPNIYHRKYSLRNHFRFVHAKNSRYYCGECNQTFLNSTKLISHRRKIHENLPPEKNKLCTICGRGFSTNRILENHMRTHTGERPFACKMCTAKFTQKVALDSHIKFIHLKARRKSTSYV